MFCTNCGKIIIDTAKFCNYCGKPVANAENIINSNGVTPASESVPTEPISVVAEAAAENNGVPAYPNENIGSTSEPVVTPADSSLFPGTEAPTAGISADPDFSAGISCPTPGVIPPSGSSAIPSYPTMNTSVVKNQDSTGQKHEHRFTLAHIIMCLTAAAIFAITAGIFAGLYFSAV